MKIPMRHHGVMMFTMALALAVVPGCMPAKAVSRAVIDVALAECAAENLDRAPEDLKTVCGFADDLLPIVRQLLAAQRRGAVKIGAPPPKL